MAFMRSPVRSRSGPPTFARCPAKVVHRSCDAAKVDRLSQPPRASVGRLDPLAVPRRLSTVAATQRRWTVSANSHELRLAGSIRSLSRAVVHRSCDAQLPLTFFLAAREIALKSHGSNGSRLARLL